MWDKLKRTLFYATFKKEDLDSIRDDIAKANRRNTQVLSTILIVFMAAMMIVASFNPTAKANFFYYMGEMLVSVVVLLLSLFVFKKNYIGINILSYIFMFSLLVFSALIGTITSAEQRATIYPVMLVLIPTLFMERPIVSNLIGLMSVGLFIGLGIPFKEEMAFNADLLNVITLYCLSIVLTIYVTRYRLKSILYEKRLAYSSDMDILTGLKNRNCYERDIQRFGQVRHENCQILFFDVNGLHEMNNAHGHDTGDKMLKYVAITLKDIFPGEIYRIGGDEFVIINLDNFDININQKITKFKDKLLEKNYFVSLGYEYALTSEFDIPLLRKKAEILMYEDKKEFYKDDRNAR